MGLRVLLKPEKFVDRIKPRRALPKKKQMRYYLNPDSRGYLLTEEGKQRLTVIIMITKIIIIIIVQEGGMEGAYLGKDGRVHIPGKRVTLYSPISPPQE